MNMFCHSRPSPWPFSRLSKIIGQALLILLLIHTGGFAKAADFTVRTINDEFAYTINGVGATPPLTLVRGQTYTFDVSACSCHAFFIGSSMGFPLGAGVVTNNNTYSGIIVFAVPLDAVNYTYKCFTHSFGNTIITVAAPPSSSTVAASNLGSAGATLNASINPNGTATTASFLYGTDPALLAGTTSTAGQAIGSGSTGVAVTAAITGLLPVTTYYFSAQATSSAGTTQGSILSFTTTSNNASLSSLTLSTGTLAPSFAGGTTNYSASVSNSTSSLTLTPTVAESHATVKVNTVSVTSGSPSGALSLSVGSNVITTVVTAQDGATTQTYTVTVTRQSILESWRQTWFGTTGNTGNAADSADPEHDGLTNYLKFATNSNPASPAPRPGKAVVNGSNIEFTYTRSKAAMSYGVTFTVEWSDTMLAGSWSTTGTGETILSDDGTVQNIKITLPAGTNGHRFVHLAVAGP